MSTLKDRIFWLHSPERVDKVDDGMGQPGPKNYQNVIVRPTFGIQITTGGVAYDDNPIITADGAAIPSTGPGRWGALYAAGRRP